MPNCTNVRQCTAGTTVYGGYSSDGVRQVSTVYGGSTVYGRDTVYGGGQHGVRQVYSTDSVRQVYGLMALRPYGLIGVIRPYGLTALYILNIR